MPARRCLLFLALACAVALTATLALAADAVTLPGSSFGLVPPPGFTPSARFLGFEDKDTGATILLLEMSAETYDTLRNSAGDDFASHRLHLTKREDFAAGSVQALLMTGSRPVDGADQDEWMLAFPGPSYTGMILVTVSHEAAATHPDAQIREALATLVVGARRPLAEAVAALPYTLEPTETARFIDRVGNGATLTIGPKDTKVLPDQPTMFIDSVPGALCKGDKRAVSQQALGSVSQLTDPAIDTATEMDVGGGPGIEIIGTATHEKSGLRMRIAQWLGPFDAATCFRMVAVVPPDQADAAIPEFRKVMGSVRPRSP